MKREGFEVYDGTHDVILKISARDASTGRRDAANCAAAKAAKRVDGVIEARIYRSRSFLLRRRKDGQKYWERYITSDGLRCEAIAFDKGGKFEAGEYELWRAPPSMKLGVRYSDGVNRKKTGRRPRKPHIIRGIRERAPRG